MNKKSGLVLRMVAGMYLSYLGIAIFSQAIKDKPSDYVMKVVISVIFLGIGIWYMSRNIRELYHLSMGDTSDPKKEKEDIENNQKKEFAKPQHDKTKFRTAPMPVIQETGVKSMEQTNLYAGNKQEEEKSIEEKPAEEKLREETSEESGEKKMTENTENESVDSEKEGAEKTEEIKETEKIEEIEEIEEIEKDYEEK